MPAAGKRRVRLLGLHDGDVRQDQALACRVLATAAHGASDHGQGGALRTRFLCLSDSVFWLYHGSSRNGSLCHTYLRTVLISALLIRMQR